MCARRGFYGSARVRRRQCASDASIKRSRPFLVHITRPLSICLRGRRPCLCSCRKAGSGQQAARTFGPCRHRYTRVPLSVICFGGATTAAAGKGRHAKSPRPLFKQLSHRRHLCVMLSVIFACPPVYYRPARPAAARSKSRAAAVTCAPARLGLQPPELLAMRAMRTCTKDVPNSAMALSAFFPRCPFFGRCRVSAK